MKNIVTINLFKLICLGVSMAIISALASSAFAQSAGLTQVGRYLSVSNQPKAEQVDLLSSIIQVHFLSEIKTVGGAINDLLRYSGYSLVDDHQQGRDLRNTLKKPLPLVDRDLGPVSLRQALVILIGPAFDLAVDPLNRTVDFQLKPVFEPALR